MNTAAVASQHGENTFTSNNNEAYEYQGQAFQEELISGGQGTEELSRQYGTSGYIQSVGQMAHPQGNAIPATLAGKADPELINRMMMAGTGQFDDMLTKYREVTEINNASLRQAKNLEDLVGIQVKRVEDLNQQAQISQIAQTQNGGTPGMLGAYSQQGKRNFDPRSDPMLFRQKVPSLGDRRFLVNQAILSSSVHKQPAQLHGIKPSRLGSADQEMLPPLKQDRKARGAFSSVASTASFQRYRDTVDVLSKATPLTHQNQQTAGKFVDNMDPESIGGMNSAVTGSAKEDKQSAEKQGSDLESVKVDQDPINALKEIFKPRRRENKRKVLDLNPIASKYRQKAREAQRQLSTGGTGPTKSRMRPKAFAEDFLMTPNPEQNMHIATPLESNTSHYQRQQEQIVPASQRTVDVRARLDNLRQLFNEEDMDEAVQEIQLEWDLEDQKNQLQREARNLKHDQAPALEDLSLMKERVRQIKGGMGLEDGQEFPRVDLRDFLSDQIKEFKKRSDPAQIEKNIPALNSKKVEVVAKAHQTRNERFKFKASTLTHIAELKKKGQDRIENLYIERVCREQSDYFFERYVHNKAKEAVRAEKLKYETAKNSQVQQSKLVFSTQQPDLLDLIPSLQNSNQLALTAKANQSEPSRYGKKPSLNLVQEKMQRIAQIDKGLERSFVKQGESSKEGDMFSPPPAVDVFQQSSGHMDMIKLQFKEKGQLRDQIVHQEEVKAAFEEQAVTSLLENERKADTMVQSPTDLNNVASPGSTVKTSGEGVVSQTQRDDVVDQQRILISQPAESHGKQTRNESSIEGNATMHESAMAPIQQDLTERPNKKDQKPKSRERTQLLPALKELRVEDMVKEFNQKRPGSPQEAPPIVSDGNMSDDLNYVYLTDSEVVKKTRRNFPTRSKNESRAAGFNMTQKIAQGADIDHVIQVPSQFVDQNNQLVADKLRELARHLPQNQQAAFENFGVVFQPKQMEIVNKRSHSYFCPKRFNRYPRFTIFFKKDGNIAMGSKDNIVSLSPHVLQYLMDEKKIQEGKAKLTEESQPEPPKVQVTKQAAQEGITTWNQIENKGHSYDPFEKVVLVKSIDNSILTSFRTLKRENNTVSETFKVLHRKFAPTSIKSHFYRALAHKFVNRQGLYSLSDNEDAVEMAQAELLAEQFMYQDDDSRTQQVMASAEHDYMAQTLKKDAQEFQIRMNQSPENQDDFKPKIDVTESQAEKTVALSRENVYRKKLPVNPKSQQANGAHRPVPNQATGRSQYSSVGFSEMKPAGVAQKVFKFEQIGGEAQAKYETSQAFKKASGNETRSLYSNVQRQDKDPFQDSMALNQNVPSFQNQIISDEAKVANVAGANAKKPGLRSKGKQDVQQQQHQIEVMVLSKVDPLDAAFPKSKGQATAKMSSFNLQQHHHQRSGKSKMTTVPDKSEPGTDAQMITKANMLRANESTPMESQADMPVGIQKQQTVDDYTSLRSNPVGTVPRKNVMKESSVDTQSVMNMQITSQIRTVPREQVLTDYTATNFQPESAGVQRNLETDQTAGTPADFGSRAPTQVKNDKDTTKNTSKYGNDFQIPDLPPILKEHLFPNVPKAQGISTQQNSKDQSNSLISPVSLSGVGMPSSNVFATQKPCRIKKFIDEIYQKDAKSRYHKQYVREDFLSAQSPIFDLQKFHALKPNDNLIKSGKGAVKELKLTDSQRVQPSIQFVNLG